MGMECLPFMPRCTCRVHQPLRVRMRWLQQDIPYRAHIRQCVRRTLPPPVLPLLQRHPGRASREDHGHPQAPLQLTRQIENLGLHRDI